MPSLDTNILVRWLVADDAAQLQAVERLLRSTHTAQTSLFVCITVVLEIEWVLRSRYGFGKTAILSGLNALLETRELEFQHEAAIEHTLHAYRNGNADFADCLHAGLCWSQGHLPMLTFDGKAAKLESARRLS